MDRWFRVMASSLDVDFSKEPSEVATLTVKPSLKVTGGTTNQKSTLSASVAPRATGSAKVRVMAVAASSAMAMDGRPADVIDTVALPAIFSPLLPCRVREETWTPSP